MGTPAKSGRIWKSPNSRSVRRGAAETAEEAELIPDQVGRQDAFNTRMLQAQLDEGAKTIAGLKREMEKMLCEIVNLKKIIKDKDEEKYIRGNQGKW